MLHTYTVYDENGKVYCILIATSEFMQQHYGAYNYNEGAVTSQSSNATVDEILATLLGVETDEQTANG